MIMNNTNYDNEGIDDDADANCAKNLDGDDAGLKLMYYSCVALLQCSASQLSHSSKNGEY